MSDILPLERRKKIIDSLNLTSPIYNEEQCTFICCHVLGTPNELHYYLISNNVVGKGNNGIVFVAYRLDVNGEFETNAGGVNPKLYAAKVSDKDYIVANIEIECSAFYLLYGFAESMLLHESNKKPLAYLITDYFLGDDLSSKKAQARLKKCNFLQRIHLINAIIKQLKQLHREFIHGDLAKGNILVDFTHLTVKLIDFNLAKKLNHIDQVLTHASIQGTYWPPEILGEKSELSAKTDIYALGIICLFLLDIVLPTEEPNKLAYFDFETLNWSKLLQADIPTFTDDGIQERIKVFLLRMVGPYDERPSSEETLGFFTCIERQIEKAVIQTAWENQLLTELTASTSHIIIEWADAKGNLINKSLCAFIANQLFTVDGKLNHDAKVKKNCNHWVKPIYNEQGELIFYAKAFPEYPGLQLMADSLSFYLRRRGLMTRLCKITHPQHKKPYVILFSEALPEDLEARMSHDPGLADLEQHLDDYAFTTKFFETLFLSFEDEQPPNATAVPVSQVLNCNNNEKYYELRGHDKDHLLAEAVVKQGSQIKVKMKSIVFCFDSMLKPLNKAAIEDILALDPYQCLQDVLQTLTIYNKAYLKTSDRSGNQSKGSVFTEQEITEFAKIGKNYCYIPACFRAGDIAKLYQRICRIKAVFQLDQPPLAHIDLLFLIEPRLAEQYGKLLNDNSLTTPEARFSRLPTDYKIDIDPKTKIIHRQSAQQIVAMPLHAVSIIDESQRKDLRVLIRKGKAFDIQQAMKELEDINLSYRNHSNIIRDLYRGNINSFRELVNADHVKEKIISDIDFEKLPLTVNTYRILNKTKINPNNNNDDDFTVVPVAQSDLLEVLLQQLDDKNKPRPYITSYRKIRLTNCKALSDEILKKLLKQSPDITDLNINNCNISKNVFISNVPSFQELAYHPSLKRLAASDLPELKGALDCLPGVLFKQPTFPQLERLIVVNNVGLTRVSLEAPHLLILDVTGCIELTEINLKNPSKLQSLYARGTKLSDAALASLVRTHLSLQQIEIPDKNQTYPLLATALIKQAENLSIDKNLTDSFFKQPAWLRALAILSTQEYVHAFNRSGKIKRDQNDMLGAISDYSKAAQLEPCSAEAFNGIGISLFSLGKYKAAIDNFNKAIEINPQFFLALNNRGLAKYKLSLYMEAIKDYDKAIQLNSKHPEFFDNRGLAKNALGYYSNAIADYNSAISIDPMYAEAYNNRSNTKEANGEYESAYEDYQIYLQLSSAKAPIFNEKGYACYIDGNYNEAIINYNKAIKLDPNLPEAFYNRGLAFYQLSKYKEAQEDFNSAISLKPRLTSEDADIFFQRGQAEYALRLYVNARYDYIVACKLKPQTAKFYYHCAQAQYQLKHYQDALTDYNQAIILRPKIAKYYKDRARCLRMLGNYQEAINDYNKAIELKKGQYPEAEIELEQCQNELKIPLVINTAHSSSENQFQFSSNADSLAVDYNKLNKNQLKQRNKRNLFSIFTSPSNENKQDTEVDWLTQMENERNTISNNNESNIINLNTNIFDIDDSRKNLSYKN
jgi:tetratricopeptide (TPR) repeat protein